MFPEVPLPRVSGIRAKCFQGSRSVFPGSRSPHRVLESPLGIFPCSPASYFLDLRNMFSAPLPVTKGPRRFLEIDSDLRSALRTLINPLLFVPQTVLEEEILAMLIAVGKGTIIPVTDQFQTNVSGSVRK